MNATVKQNEEFTDAIWPSWPLDAALEWINENMKPEDAFTEDKLTAWAVANGYTRES